MALDLHTATSGTGNGFLGVHFFFSLEFRAVNLLVCELVYTQFKALSLLTDTAGTGSGLLL
jgi:hypothetical protein